MPRGASLKSFTPPLSIPLPARRAEEPYRVFVRGRDLEPALRKTVTTRNLHVSAAPILHGVATAFENPLYVYI
jgi:hypothetical protein